MESDLLETIAYYAATSDYSLRLIFFNIFFAAVLAGMTGWVYSRTHRGNSYSPSFVSTLVMVAVISAVAMMVIGNSITRAFALLGTFSIVRFRTAVKESKDTAYVFLCLVIGIAAGTGNYQIATASTVFLLLIIQLMHSFNFGSVRKHDHVISFVLNTRQAEDEDFQAVFDDYLDHSELLNVHAVDKGNKLEFNYRVKIKKRLPADEFLKEMSRVKSLSEVSLLSSKNDVEY